MSFLEFDKSVKTKSWSMNSLHSHPHYEIYFLSKGERLFFLSNSLYTLGAGTLVVVPPYAMHKTEGGPFERFNINVSTDYLDSFQKKTLDVLAKGIAIKIPESKMQEIKKLLSQMSESERLLNYKDNVKSALFGYFIYLISNIAEENKVESSAEILQNAPPIVLKMINYLTDNYDKKISLETLEKTFFLSKTTLCKQFSKAINCTIADFLLNIRLNKAKFYLTETKKTMTEIADLCGFCSQNYFGLIFKQKTGLSPLNYRKHQTQKIR